MLSFLNSFGLVVDDSVHSVCFHLMAPNVVIGVRFFDIDTEEFYLFLVNFVYLVQPPG